MSKLSPSSEPAELILRRVLQRVLLRRMRPRSKASTGRAPEPTLGEGSVSHAGRRPMGLLSEARDRKLSQFGDYLARCAHLEAASVIAFERLAAELLVHGAPLDLVDGARSARLDEVRHAEVIGRMARVYGGEPVQPVVCRFSPRALEAIALENAAEGCVRETYAALSSGYQAMAATEPALRAALSSIARDEARHAALAHRVHRWIYGRLDRQARYRVHHEKERALFALAAELGRPVDPALQYVAGLPPPEIARDLLRELARNLWRASRLALSFELRARS